MSRRKKKTSARRKSIPPPSVTAPPAPSPGNEPLTEAEIYKLLLHSEINTRFTQDSPILPEVWVGFARAPGAILTLLLTPLAGTRFPKQNLIDLRSELAGKFSRDSPFAWLDECLLVSVTWPELFNVLLPRTAWFQRLRQARATRPDGNRRAARRPSLSAAESERSWWWLMRVIATIDLSLCGRHATARNILSKPLSLVIDDRLLQAELERTVESIWEIESTTFAPSIYSIAPNRSAERAVERSRLTVKADAAERLFGLNCANITWGVIDAGMDARHIGFAMRDADGRPRKALKGDFSSASRVVATYDFSLFTDIFRAITSGKPEDFPPEVQHVAANLELVNSVRSSLVSGSDIPWNEFSALLRVPHTRAYAVPADAHGTHVGGIIGADVREGELDDADLDGPLRGICPEIRLIDLRVFDRHGKGDEFSILAALQFVRYLNRSSDRQRVHGVNLSLSLRHNVKHYACGSTPICRECDRLVGSGVVAVAAAGNHGFAENVTNWAQDSYRPISITDPGNADCVITVGATHRESPHTYGVSYFSSRGPTGDGRAKPDIVAPGEKILSLQPENGVLVQDGTSMAAPHVSGVAALLLARHPELSGRPSRIKELLCSTALDLKRERSFQGAGLVDALKALQSI